MRLPQARGPLSEELIDALRRDRAVVDTAAPAADSEDLQLALWVLYELHYGGFAEVDDRREWDPDLIRLRQRLEEPFEAMLREGSAPISALADGVETVPDQLEAIVGWSQGESLPHFLQREATRDQYLEFLTQRSVYHLKEADPHAWALPRLRGAAKTALAELLHDEYGGGRPDRLHSRLFAEAMECVGLDAAYGSYVDRVPAYTLVVNNTMSLFGLNRRLRAASMGHLAAFEMTSSMPARRCVSGADRLHLGEPVRRYFDEHVEADAVHEQIAARDICSSLVAAEPHLAPDVHFGAAACILVDGAAGDRMVTRWRSGSSTLVSIDEVRAA